MNRAQLIDAVLEEMERVWGPEGFDGENAEYEWLEDHYAISEEDDVQWQLILQYNLGNLPEEDLDDDDVMAFLEDNFAVVLFLEKLLRRYRSGSDTYLRARR